MRGRARLTRYVRQPHRILADGIGGDQSEGRPGTGEVRLAAAKHKRAEVETILVDQTEVGEVPREFGPGDVDFALDFRLQLAHERFDVASHERSVRAYRLERACPD